MMGIRAFVQPFALSLLSGCFNPFLMRPFMGVQKTTGKKRFEKRTDNDRLYLIGDNDTINIIVTP